MNLERGFQPEPTELPDNQELEAPLALDALPGQLGFIETPELMDLREDLIKAAAQRLDLKELVTDYARLGEKLVEERPRSAAFSNDQIGLMIAIGLNWRDVGNNDRYLEELEDADVFADGLGLKAVSDTLKLAIAQVSLQ